MVKFQRLGNGPRGVPPGTRVALQSGVNRGTYLRSAATVLGLVAGMAAPARAQSEPSIEVIEAPPRPEDPTSDPDAPPPLTPHWVHRVRPAFIAAGAATFGASYVPAVLFALFTTTLRNTDVCGATCGPQNATLLIPILGPWLTFRQEPGIWPAVWSGVQAVGVGMLVAGLIGHDVLEWRPRGEGPRVSLVPGLTPQLGALALNATW